MFVMFIVWTIFWLMILLCTAFVAITFAISLFDKKLSHYYLSKTLQTKPLKNKNIVSYWYYLKAFIGEIFACVILVILRCLSWIKPPTIKEVKKETLYVLIHGFNQTWSITLWLYYRLTRNKNYSVLMINLFPPFVSIEKHASLLRKKIEEIASQHPVKRLFLIGHSMGALVASYYTEFLSTPSYKEISIISLGAPYHGSKLAVFCKGPNSLEMMPNSEFVTKLTEKIKTDPKGKYLNIASKLDNIVVPWHSSYIEHKQHTTALFNDLGHISLLFSNRVFKKILSTIREENARYDQQAEKKEKESEQLEKINAT